jgi:hypothetical protein
MDTAAKFVSTTLNGFLDDSWRWFNNLNREEWLIVLAVFAITGFLCLRGFGSRSEF